MKVGSLEIELLANMARLQKDMQDAQRMVGNAMQGIERSVAGAKRALEGLGVALSVVAVADFLKHAVEAADEMGKLAQRTGVAVEALSQLQFAAKLSNVSSGDLTTGLKKLNLAIDGGVAGSKQQVTAFKNLGVALKDSNGQVKSADQVLLEVADSFAHATDGAIKTAYAVALFGKAGDQLIPMLNGGSEAIKAMMEKADRLGLTISKDFAARAEEFNDNLTILKASGDKLAVTMGETVVKALGDAAKAMADAAVEGGKLHALKVGLDQLGEAFFNWSGKQQLKGITWLRDDIKTLTAQLNSPVVDMFGQMDGIRTQLEQKTAELDKALQQYFKLTDKAGGGRGFVNPQLLGQVGTIAQQTATQLKALGGGANEAEAAYESLIKRIQERIDADNAALKAGRELTDAEKFEVKAQTDLNLLLQKYPGLSRAAAEAKIKEARASDEKTEAMKREQQNAIYYHNEREQQIQDELALDKQMTDETARVTAQLDDQQRAQKAVNEEMALEAGLLGATDAERRLALQLLKIEQDRKEAIRKITEDSLDLDKAGHMARQNALAAEAVQLAMTQKGLDDYSAAWGRVDDIGKQVWTDLWTKGSNVLKDLGHLIKTALIDTLYQLVVKKWIFSIFADITGGAGGLAGAAATGAVQGGVSALTGGAGVFAGGAAALGSFGTAAGYGASALFSGTGLTALSGGASMVAAGSIAQGLGMIAGVLGPIAAGAALLYSVLGSKHGGPKVEGGSGTGGLASFGDTKTAQEAASAIQQQWQGYAGLFGLNANMPVGFQFGKDPQGPAKSQLNITGGSYNRASLYGGEYENVARGDTAFDAEVAHSTAQLFIKNLQDQLTGPLGDVVKAINITTASTEQMQHALDVVKDIGAFDMAMRSMGTTFSSLTSLSVETKQAVIEKFGGVDKLSAGLGTVYDKFFTEEEKRAALQAQVTAAFQAAGVALPATLDAYKQAWLDAKDHLDDPASLQIFTTLTQNAGAFYDAAQQVAGATSQLSDAMKSLQDQSNNLLIQIMRARGDETGAFTAQRFLDTRGLTDSEIAQYDANVLLQRQLDEVTAANQRAITVDQQRASLQDQLNQLTLTNGELMQLERAGIDASNQALYDAVQAARAQAAQDQADAQKAQQVQQSRKQLQDQIWEAEGNTAALRNEELDVLRALDPALAAMQQRLYDLQDSAALMDNVTRTRGVLVSAYEKEASALQQTADRAKAFAEGIKQFRQSLVLDGALSALNPQQRYAAAQANLQTIAAAARAGDATAQGQVQNAVQQFLQLSRTMFGSTDFYTRDFATTQAILSDLEGSATSQADVAMQQLAAINEQLDKLRSIDDSAKTISQALADYTAAIIAAVNAGLSPDNPLHLNIPGHAAGGWHSGGWSWVGEQGPELRYMPPSRVYSHGDSRDMMAAANEEVVVAIDRLGDRIGRLEQSNVAGHVMTATATRQSSKTLSAAVGKGQWSGTLKKKSALK
jgi:hypothetical protein